MCVCPTQLTQWFYLYRRRLAKQRLLGNMQGRHASTHSREIQHQIRSLIRSRREDLDLIAHPSLQMASQVLEVKINIIDMRWLVLLHLPICISTPTPTLVLPSLRLYLTIRVTLCHY